MGKKQELVLATADCETDPFEYGVIPKPFVWGFYSLQEGYCHFWGEGKTREEQEESCLCQFMNFLDNLEQPHIIYMHNGGKFDFLFLMAEIYGSLKIVNGRILEARIGPHVLRDSYAAVPIPLSAYKKDDIDYGLLAFGKRFANKSEILHYLGGDVRYLFEMMQAFRGEFGNVLTIGTAAMRALKHYHPFDEFNSDQDAFFRQFYYGGRNQCFEKGEVKGDFIVVDANSMYPACMHDMLHPVSNTYNESDELTDDTDFVIVSGRNFGALPFKDKLSLNFTAEYGKFYTTGHELRAALDTGTFEIDTIHSAYTFAQRICFAEFVDTYFGKRLASRLAGEDLYVLFWKLILNSAYGKFCLNSDNFKDWELTEYNEYLDDSIWTLEYQTGDFLLWSKPCRQVKFFNVATGASITGGARSKLLRGLAVSERPIYCDTDSIICTAFHGEIHESKLGAWDKEAEGDTVYIAGKKLYALYRNGSVVKNEKGIPKQASKGARLTADQIKNAALGGVELFRNPVPAFKLNGNHQFIARHIRMTGDDVSAFGNGRTQSSIIQQTE